MSFNPIFDYYVMMNTASYIEPSSSVGAFQMKVIENNLEWSQHFINSQTLINNINSYETGQSYGENPETPIIVTTYGPFRIYLDKSGIPLPIHISLAGYSHIQSTSLAYIPNATAKLQAILRLDNQIGYTSQIQIGEISTQTTSSSGSDSQYLYRSFVTENAEYITSSFDVSSSVVQTNINVDNHTQFKSRLNKTVPDPALANIQYNNVQYGAMAYIDIRRYFTNVTSSAVRSQIKPYTKITRFYARQVNIRE